ncbi:MAG TPA: cupredoxin domain-containing protein [Alphaproteobacteria bacterium]|nr:cupredoxin domain-containing protein [Alphaproteobacteria bacterium]
MQRTLIAVLGTLAFMAIVAATATIAAPPEPQVVKLTVKKFEYSPRVVTVKKGVPVVIEITSLDRLHGFKLPAFNVRADVNPGEVARVTFTPNEAGEFDFLCDIFCGDGHEDVTGTLVVKD